MIDGTIQATIVVLTEQIAVRQDAIRSLQKLLPGTESASTEASARQADISPTPPLRGRKAKGKRGPYKKRGAATSVSGPPSPRPSPPGEGERAPASRRSDGNGQAPASALKFDPRNPDGSKPDTCAGAMKLIIRQVKKFTKGDLMTALKSDADFARISLGSNDCSFWGNLSYWTSRDYLRRDGDVYSVATPEWFEFKPD